MEENNGQITILNVKELNFELNKDVDLEKLKGSRLKIGFLSGLGYKEDSDDIKFNVGFRVLYDENSPLITYGLSFDVELKGFSEMSHREADVRMNPVVERLLAYCYAFLGGAMMKHTDGTGLKRFYLPILKASEMMPLLVVEELRD